MPARLYNLHKVLASEFCSSRMQMDRWSRGPPNGYIFEHYRVLAFRDVDDPDFEPNSAWTRLFFFYSWCVLSHYTKKNIKIPRIYRICAATNEFIASPSTRNSCAFVCARQAHYIVRRIEHSNMQHTLNVAALHTLLPPTHKHRTQLRGVIYMNLFNGDHISTPLALIYIYIV